DPAAQIERYVNDYYDRLFRPIDQLMQRQRNIEEMIEAAANSPARRFVEQLEEAQRRSQEAYDRLNDYGRLAEQASFIDRFTSNVADRAALEDYWRRQSEALKGARTAASQSFAQAQAVIKGADELPPGEDKDEIVAEAARTEEAATGIDAI